MPRFALLPTVVITPVLATAYAARSPDRTRFLALLRSVVPGVVSGVVGEEVTDEPVAERRHP